MDYDYDLLILGGGSAGYAAARTGHELGLKTVVVDGAETLGGLCILRGCMPSKTLIESGNRMLSARRASEFGIHTSAPTANVSAIRDRKRSLIGEFAEYRQNQLADGRFDLIRARGAFSDAHTLKLDDGENSSLTFATAVVATGSKVTTAPIPGLAESGYLVSDDILEAASLPESLIVLGGGAIALELTHYLEAIGRRVSIIQRSPRFLKELDHDLSPVVEDAFRGRGIDVYTGTSISNVTSTEDGKKQVSFQHGEKGVIVTADEIVYALGRRATTDGLGLDEVGVILRKNGQIESDHTLATSAPNIFAAGDVTGPHEIVHVAIEQGEAAAINAAVLLGKLPPEKKRSVSYRLKLFGVFCEPQVATVGLSEQEAAAKGMDFATASYPFDDHGKSMVMGETHGFVKMITDKSTGEIIGASVVGPEAADLIHEVVVAMHFKATAQDFLTIPHYHPTLSEIWTYPAEELALTNELK
ncbi:MAG: NAD(P)/FAD-dependent oxidoreductase [Verrucomicrobiota bacterium]